MPFDSWMDITTIERYVGVWKQLLLFVFRAEEDEPEFRPPYVLTDGQQIAMRAVNDKIMAFQKWKKEVERAEEEVEIQGEDEGFEEEEEIEEEEIEEGAGDGEGEEDRLEAGEDEGFEDEESEEDKWMREIEREVLRFCIALLDYQLQDNEYDNAIISGLAVLGIKDDKAWFDAEDYIPKYSAVIKLAWLMVVQEAYEQRQEQICRY